jgi:hypothetical protein
MSLTGFVYSTFSTEEFQILLTNERFHLLQSVSLIVTSPNSFPPFLLQWWPPHPCIMLCDDVRIKCRWVGGSLDSLAHFGSTVGSGIVVTDIHSVVSFWSSRFCTCHLYWKQNVKKNSRLCPRIPVSTRLWPIRVSVEVFMDSSVQSTEISRCKYKCLLYPQLLLHINRN